MKRRSFLQGLLAWSASLLVPLKLGAEALTEMDRILLEAVRERFDRKRFQLTGIQVHRELYERMTLRSIDGVPIEVTDRGPDGNGDIQYYWIWYSDPEGLVHTGVSVRNRPGQIDNFIATSKSCSPVVQR